MPSLNTYPHSIIIIFNDRQSNNFMKNTYINFISIQYSLATPKNLLYLNLDSLYQLTKWNLSSYPEDIFQGHFYGDIFRYFLHLPLLYHKTCGGKSFLQMIESIDHIDLIELKNKVTEKSLSILYQRNLGLVRYAPWWCIH